MNRTGWRGLADDLQRVGVIGGLVLTGSGVFAWVWRQSEQLDPGVRIVVGLCGAAASLALIIGVLWVTHHYTGWPTTHPLEDKTTLHSPAMLPSPPSTIRVEVGPSTMARVEERMAAEGLLPVAAPVGRPPAASTSMKDDMVIELRSITSGLQVRVTSQRKLTVPHAHVVVQSMDWWYDPVKDWVPAPETPPEGFSRIGLNGNHKLSCGSPSDFTFIHAGDGVDILRVNGYSLQKDGRANGTTQFHTRQTGRWRVSIRVEWEGYYFQRDDLHFAWDGRSKPVV